LHQNKFKNFNDPVYGFVSIPNELIFDLIEHPYFQRLRRISQLGLTSYVYPGAHHTRFQHVIGAMNLTDLAIKTLEFKGVTISEEEKVAVCAAVLLHDIGHGPYSHSLESSLVSGFSHEEISLLLMTEINEELQGRLDLCIEIFTDRYHKKFLHQLVASQLDMDRLDYLRRDSFYTGVQEGVVGQDRIIKMLNVHNGELVIDEKGIYSIEKFLIARRLMYWQVYLHKTVVAAEAILVKVIERAKFISRNGDDLFATPVLKYFLDKDINQKSFLDDKDSVSNFTRLDDFDIMASIKTWCTHPDKTLRTLSQMLINRNLPKVEFSNKPFDANYVNSKLAILYGKNGVSENEGKYFVFSDSVKNKAYNLDHFNIKILYKDGNILDISKASDQYNIEALAKSVTKYFLCYPKNL